MVSRFCLVFLASYSFVTTTGFSVPERPSTRQIFLQDVLTAVTVGSVVLPQAANADITSQLAAPAALRAIKRARKKISNLEDIVLLGDYTGIKTTLRLDSISDLRKSCSTIIKATEDGPNAESVLQNYKSMIASLEKLDSLASVGMRGRKVGVDELKASYDSFVASLDSLIEISETLTIEYDGKVSS